jgi:hypothetical protein
MQNKKSEEFEELEKPTFKVGDDSNINNPNDPNKFGAEFPFMYDQANRRIRKRPEMIPYTFAFGNDRLTSYFKIEADGTPVLVGDATTWKDINVAGVILAKPASSNPGIDNFRDLNGTDTTIPTYAFAVDEYLTGGFELQHDYKEGSDITFHVHWQGIAAPSGTDNVQWRITYVVSRDNVALAAAVTVDSPDTAIDTQYKCYRTDFAVITGTNFKIGDQFMFNLYRVASTGDAYLGDALIQTAGIHYQSDTLGSRTITTK